MVHGSLFSGIGGFDLASERMGWENAFHCEVSEFGRKILEYYWPKAKSHGNIKTTDFTSYKNKIDVLTGGFPCQPFSVAGKKGGNADDRYLWPEMFRAVREVQPIYVVGENVPGLLGSGNGMVFEQICSDLETQGYEVAPVLLPACGKNAPHKRERLWIVAYNHSFRQQRRRPTGNSQKIHIEKIRSDFFCKIDRYGIFGITADTDSKRLGGKTYRNGKSKLFNKNSKKDYWENFPIEPPVCCGNDEFSNRLDGITFSKWRRESIKGYGNAVLPLLVYDIFKSIENHFHTSNI